jgi:DDE family transposase
MMELSQHYHRQETAMLSMSQALERIKGDTTQFIDPPLIRSLCRELELDGRNRLLTPVVTTHLFVRQVLEGNTSVPELRRLAKFSFAESSYCDARQRLPLAFFQGLNAAVLDRCRRYAQDDPRALWHGHRVFFLDGSSFSMPDTPDLRDEFGQSGNQAEGCGFPTAHLLVQFHAYTGYLIRAIPAPLRTHDLAEVALTHRNLHAGDVVCGDRAFCSYAHLALLQQRGAFGLFRAHQRQIISFKPHRPHLPPGRKPQKGEAGLPRSRWLRRLGRHDQLVEYFKPAECPAWLDRKEYEALPASLIVREVRVKVATPGCRVRELTLVTTLLDRRRYPKEALARLYAKRWQTEVNLRHLKQTLQMDVLRCTTWRGVWKELLVFVIVYNLVRRVMLEAARQQAVEPDRISFVDALRWLREAQRGEPVPRLKVNPERPGRVEPRVRKRRPKEYDLMNKPRSVLRAKLLHQTSPPEEDAA